MADWVVIRCLRQGVAESTAVHIAEGRRAGEPEEGSAAVSSALVAVVACTATAPAVASVHASAPAAGRGRVAAAGPVAAMPSSPADTQPCTAAVGIGSVAACIAAGRRRWETEREHQQQLAQWRSEPLAGCRTTFAPAGPAALAAVPSWAAVVAAG